MDYSQKFKVNPDGTVNAPICEAAQIGIRVCEHLVGGQWCDSPKPCGSKLQPDGTQTRMDAFIGEVERRASLKHAREVTQAMDEADMADLDYMETLENIVTPERRDRREIRRH